LKNWRTPLCPLEVGYIKSYRRAMPDSRTILPARGRWLSLDRLRVLQREPFLVPGKMLRARIQTLSAMTLDKLGAPRWNAIRSGNRPQRYYRFGRTTRRVR
jgi:hypothetical protein